LPWVGHPRCPNLVLMLISRERPFRSWKFLHFQNPLSFFSRMSNSFMSQSRTFFSVCSYFRLWKSRNKAAHVIHRLKIPTRVIKNDRNLVGKSIWASWVPNSRQRNIPASAVKFYSCTNLICNAYTLFHNRLQFLRRQKYFFITTTHLSITGYIFKRR